MCARSPKYDDVHIPGSVLIPLGELPARLAEDSRLIATSTCTGRMGWPQRPRVDYLRHLRAGRTRTTFSGGIEAWEEAGCLSSTDPAVSADGESR